MSAGDPKYDKYLDDIVEEQGASPLTPPSMTHTGTFVIPLVLRRQDDWNIQDALLGDNTSKELPNTKGIGVTELYYDENSYSGTNRLNTLSMNDLEYCGTIYFRNLAGLTSLQFLKLIASIGLNMGDLSCYNGIYLSTIPIITTLTFTELVHTTNFVLMSLGLSGAGVAISAPKLKYISNVGTGQGSLNMVNCKINGGVSLPELESVANVYLQQLTNCTSVLLPKLKRVISAFSMTTLSSVTSTDFSLLEDVMGNFSIKTFGSSASPITSLDFPLLAQLRGGVSTFTDVNALALNLPSMVTYNGGITFAGANRMATVVLGTIGTLKKVGGSVLLPMTGSYGINLASVNAIIALLASLNGTNGTTSFSGTVTLTGGTTATPSFNLTTQTKAGTAFTGSGTTCTVTWVGHGYSTGDLLTITGITGAGYANGTFFIVRDTADQFHFTIPNQQSPTTGAGTATVKKANSTTDTYYYKQLILNRGGTVNNMGSN